MKKQDSETEILETKTPESMKSPAGSVKSDECEKVKIDKSLEILSDIISMEYYVEGRSNLKTYYNSFIELLKGNEIALQIVNSGIVKQQHTAEANVVGGVFGAAGNVVPGASALNILGDKAKNKITCKYFENMRNGFRDLIQGNVGGSDFVFHQIAKYMTFGMQGTIEACKENDLNILLTKNVANFVQKVSKIRNDKGCEVDEFDCVSAALIEANKSLFEKGVKKISNVAGSGRTHEELLQEDFFDFRDYVQTTDALYSKIKKEIISDEHLSQSEEKLFELRHGLNTSKIDSDEKRAIWKKIIEQDDKISKIETQLKDTKEENIDSKAKIVALNTQVSSLSSKIDEFEKKEKNYEASISDLQKKDRESKSDIKYLQQQVALLMDPGTIVANRGSEKHDNSNKNQEKQSGHQ